MAEEFEESEVMFQVEDDHEESNDGYNFDELINYSRNNNNNKVKRKKQKTNKTNSKPVSIPENVSWMRYVDPDLDDGDGEMVPPHVIIGRRVAGKMTSFSVCTGNGRTLKGRDLSEVRNSVLRMTGFLET